MRIAVLANPRAGRGRGLRAQAAILRCLSEAGIAAEALVISPHLDLAAAARQCDILVIAGGDGTVHHSLPALAHTPAAIYHFPTGTENLFARELGSHACEHRLLEVLRRPSFQSLDLGRLTTSRDAACFAVMCSLGPDAGVIHRLAQARRGAITHLAYIEPVLAELCEPSIPCLSLWIDGRLALNARRGLLVIANARQYALRADPAPMANPCDGLLDVAFLPGDSGPALIAQLVACRFRRPGRVLSGRGRHIQLRVDHPTPSQLDGEPGPIIVDQAEFTVLPSALRVVRCRD